MRREDWSPFSRTFNNKPPDARIATGLTMSTPQGGLPAMGAAACLAGPQVSVSPFVVPSAPGSRVCCRRGAVAKEGSFGVGLNHRGLVAADAFDRPIAAGQQWEGGASRALWGSSVAGVEERAWVRYLGT